jgi:hypothetical protein
MKINKLFAFFILNIFVTAGLLYFFIPIERENKKLFKELQGKGDFIDNICNLNSFNGKNGRSIEELQQSISDSLDNEDFFKLKELIHKKMTQN